MSSPRLKKMWSAQGGHRIDKYISDVSEEVIGEFLSRSRVLDLIKSSLVTVNGKTPKPSYKTQNEDSIEVTLPELAPSALQAYDFPIEILFEDDSCIVVNKPAGLVVHPAAGHEQDTLVNILLAKVKKLAVGITEHRPGIVHRLDKDTSGVLVVAKTDAALRGLAEQFKAKSVTRHYYAWVYGEWPWAKTTITSNLARHPNQRKKFHSAKVGKHAVTHVERIKSKNGLTLLRCRLETGRTHQIRVHLSDKGHPIINDPIYSSGKGLKNLSSHLRLLIEDMSGIGLHAYELGFVHPVTKEFRIFKTPWPQHLKPMIQELQIDDIQNIG